PLVVVEMAPTGDRRVIRDGLPAVVPDRPGAQHRVELRRPRRRRIRLLEAGSHAHTIEATLDVALDRLWSLDAEHVEDGRDDVDRVVVLVANLALGLQTCRPRDDARIARAAVEFVALPHLERR